MTKKTSNAISTIIASVIIIFLAPVIIRFGWNILAYHFNLPQFTYWEVFWIRWAAAVLLKPIFGRGFNTVSDED